MKTIRILAALVILALAPPAMAAPPPEQAKILADDARGAEIQDMTFGMFVCWSFSTFCGHEWTPGVEDISFFNPTGFDPDQWCRAARDANMKYILLLTKHHDGFCLWDTQTTDRKVSKTPAMKGVDVLAEVKKACDRHGLKLALYFSEGDWSWTPENKGIHQSAARPEIKKAQLRELLTGYGPIEFIWFDHAIGDGGLSHKETAAWVHRFQPNTFCGFNTGETAGRLNLRERGRPGPIGDKSAVSGKNHLKSDYSRFQVAELTYPILEGQKRTKMRGAQWFYSLPENDRIAASPEKIYHDYVGAKKFGNIFSLDVGPDRSGRLREIDVTTLQKVGQYIRGEALPPSQPLAVTATTASSVWDRDLPAGKAVDGDFATRWGAAKDTRDGWLQLDLGEERIVSRALVDEAGYGRIQSFRIELRQGETWSTVFAASTCGDRKSIRFNKPVTGRFFRLKILKASEVPTIAEFQLFE